MTLMWEVRAADGQADELVARVESAADPSALVYRSSDRVVVIDPTGRGVHGIPDELLARPPHVWTFEPVPRVARTGTGNDSSFRE
ncbi:MAG: hypothetical protein ACRDVG_04290 [Jatrophihabitantaceae bacterium]